MTVIGCRPCDAAALAVIDKVFAWDYDDVRYRARREAATVVTFACSRTGDTCFCTSVGGSPHGTLGSDVVIYDHAGQAPLIEAMSEKGEAFVSALGDAAKPAPEGAVRPDPPQMDETFDLDKVKPWLDDNFESDFWNERVLGCLGCAACTFLCPTCHCFDIVDEGDWQHGRRLRNWDSCAFGHFTLHAAGHNPRPNRAARFRQRVMHKFKYFPERFGMTACVGCGRCISTCGAGRSISDILTEISSQPKGAPHE